MERVDGLRYVDTQYRHGNDLFAEFRKESQAEKESINDNVVFEIELIKQVEVNVDYVLMLVRRYLAERGPAEDVEIRAAIGRAIDSSPSLRNKKDLIEQFVDSLTVDAEWQEFVLLNGRLSWTKSSRRRGFIQVRRRHSLMLLSATAP